MRNKTFFLVFICLFLLISQGNKEKKSNQSKVNYELLSSKEWGKLSIVYR